MIRLWIVLAVVASACGGDIGHREPSRAQVCIGGVVAETGRPCVMLTPGLGVGS